MRRRDTPAWRVARSLDPGRIVTATASRDGLGLLVACAVPRFGPLRLVHWLRSPYEGVADGVVDDADSVRVQQMRALPGTMRWQARGVAAAPGDRGGWANRLSADACWLVGLRGWDIPHDRHLVLTRVATGAGTLAPDTLPAAVAAAWSLSGRTTDGDAGAMLYASTNLPQTERN